MTIKFTVARPRPTAFRERLGDPGGGMASSSNVASSSNSVELPSYGESQEDLFPNRPRNDQSKQPPATVVEAAPAVEAQQPPVRRDRSCSRDFFEILFYIGLAILFFCLIYYVGNYLISLEAGEVVEKRGLQLPVEISKIMTLDREGKWVEFDA